MRRLILSLFVITLLSSCGSMSTLIPSHKLTIYQGNTITQDMLDQLQIGMSKKQVRSILGSSLLEDPFHANRWDYNYTVVRGNKIKEQNKISVYFDENGLSKIEGKASNKTKDASKQKSESSVPLNEATK